MAWPFLFHTVPQGGGVKKLLFHTAPLFFLNNYLETLKKVCITLHHLHNNNNNGAALIILKYNIIMLPPSPIYKQFGTLQGI